MLVTGMHVYIQGIDRNIVHLKTILFPVRRENLVAELIDSIIKMIQ